MSGPAPDFKSLEVGPADIAPVLLLKPEGGLELQDARWWFISRKHSRTFAERPRLASFNARAETIANSSMFKEAFAVRRCLVPADAWYEQTGKPHRRTTWEFTPKGGGTIYFAGLWEQYRDSEVGPICTFAIITEPAGCPLNAYHDRAPVVLWGIDRHTWLDPRASRRELHELLGPESPDGFDVRQLSGPCHKARKSTQIGKPAGLRGLTLGDKPTRNAANLLAKAVELEKLGRFMEAACYRRDVENMVARHSVAREKTRDSILESE